MIRRCRFAGPLIGWSAALLVQVGGLWLLLSDQRVERPKVERVTTIRLLSAPVQPAMPRDQRARLVPPRASTARSIPKVPPTSSALPVPSMHAIETPAVRDGSLADAAPPPSIALRPAPLQLSLPPRRPASGPMTDSVIQQAVNDPRSNSAALSVEYRIADAAGTLPIVHQASNSGSGSRLVRQGSQCTRVTANRVREANPTDDRLKGFQDVAGPCVN